MFKKLVEIKKYLFHKKIESDFKDLKILKIKCTFDKSLK